MRKTITIGLLFLSLLTWTGCIRIANELEVIPPPKRFYASTRHLPEMLVLMGMIPDGVHPHRASAIYEIPFAAALFTIAAVDIPLEVALDTLLLPVDALLLACYKVSPPLDKYYYDNDLAGLKEQLEKGADPNAIPPWFMEKRPLIYMAYINNKKDFFELLLKHGAKLPFYALSLYYPHTADMLRMASQNGSLKALLENKEAQFVVPKLIKQNLEYSFEASRDDNALADAIITLLEQGFPPHEWKHTEGGNPDRKTPLDVVLENNAMETAAKDRLVAAMRAHGAKTYCETHNLTPSVKALKTNVVAISPMFQPVVVILKESKQADLFVFSDSYPDVDGPVLVVDKPFHNPFNNKETAVRRSIKFHRRVSTTGWSDCAESLDVPAIYRIVLTPPGKRLPSRRPQGMPTERNFWEAWYTLPTCELYIEHAMHCGSFPDRDLLKICLLFIDVDDKRELLRRLVFAPSKVEPSVLEYLKWPAAKGYGEKSLLDTLTWNNVNNSAAYDLSKPEREWLANATKALAHIGITAEWRKAYGFGIHASYAFSTHRDLGKTTAESLPLVPKPDEIVVVLLSEITTSRDRELFSNICIGPAGKDYWNAHHGQVTYPINTKHRKGHVHHDLFIFTGDSVPQERVEQIIKVLETSFDGRLHR